MKKGGVNIITNDLVKILLIFAEYKEKKSVFGLLFVQLIFLL